jgi:outer membrane protein assembly factor BamE (lipoprotein component of BamABCDE complex)
MKRMQGLCMVMLLATLFFGCASVGRKIDQSAVEKIEKGKTTREEVIRLLGSPDNITILGNGDSYLSYNYARAAMKPESLIPIFGAFVGGANVQSQMVMVTIDKNGVVKNILRMQGGTEASQGIATGGKAEMPDVELNKRAK